MVATVTRLKDEPDRQVLHEIWRVRVQELDPARDRDVAMRRNGFSVSAVPVPEPRAAPLEALDASIARLRRDGNLIEVTARRAAIWHAVSPAYCSQKPVNSSLV